MSQRAPGSGVSKKCPESVPGVSKRCPGHPRDTFWALQSPGPKGPRRHPLGHSSDTPVFGDTLGDTLGTLWARRARETPVAGRGGCNVIWIQEGFTAEPPRNDSGTDFGGNDSGFGPKVRVIGQKSELQTKSQSYSGADPQNPNRIAQKRNPNRVWVLLQKRKPPLIGNRDWGGSRKGGFQIVEHAAFSSRGNLLLQRNSYLKLTLCLLFYCDIGFEDKSVI